MEKESERLLSFFFFRTSFLSLVLVASFSPIPALHHLCGSLGFRFDFFLFVLSGKSSLLGVKQDARSTNRPSKDGKERRAEQTQRTNRDPLPWS